MPYILQADILGSIPAAHLIEALDDNEDGAEDPGVWDMVAASAATEIDGILGGRYATPFVDPIPAQVKNAARVLVLENLYQRRGVPADANPYTAQAKEIRLTLTAIAKGDLPLEPGAKKVQPSGAVISEKSPTYLSSGQLA